MSQLTFKNQGLKVDYIALNVRGLIDPKPIAKIARYFQLFGFNSQIKQGYADSFRTLGFEETNQFQVSFIRIIHPYWTGTIISLPAENAAYFYDLLQKHTFNLCILKEYSVNLGRFDIHYLRKLKANDQTDLIKTFLQESYQYAKSKGRKVELQRNKKGSILRINDRKSSNYYRVYQKYDGLEFELEMKKDAIQSLQNLFFSTQLKEFEEKITKHFYRRYQNSVTLHTPWTDWLLDRLRRIQTQENKKPFLLTGYLTNIELQSFSEKQRFFYFIQFLSFIQEFKALESKDNKVYQITFPAIQFLHFIGGDVKKHYQRNKILKILQSFQTLSPVLEKFSENHFRSSVPFPILEIEKKGNRKTWIVTLNIVKELYFYPYPFNFPVSFRTYKNKYDLHVKVQILRAVATTEIEKTICIDDIYGSNILSNKDRTITKQIFIKLLNELKKSNQIQRTFRLFNSSAQITETKKLTPLLLTQNKTILLRENTNYSI